MADESTEQEILTALRIAQRRGILPTRLGTAELRGLAAGIRAGAVFSARTTSAIYLTRMKEVLDALTGGELDLPATRLALKEMLDALGYTPEGGFPQEPSGTVPPAVAGTLEDLRSDRRLNLILRTQEALMNGAAQKLRGTEEQAVRMFPAWELVRVDERRVPRDWPARWVLALENLDRPAEPVRDAQGGIRLVAMKGDPIWAALGSSELFNDALDVDHPPFAFESGMGWRAVPAAEVEALGVTGPAGEPLKDIVDALPRPKASTAGIDPGVLARLKAELDAEEAEKGILTMKGRVKP